MLGLRKIMWNYTLIPSWYLIALFKFIHSVIFNYAKLIIFAEVYISYLQKYNELGFVHFSHFVCKSWGSTIHGPCQKSRTYIYDPVCTLCSTELHPPEESPERTCQQCYSCSRLFHHHSKCLSISLRMLIYYTNKYKYKNCCHLFLHPLVFAHFYIWAGAKVEVSLSVSVALWFYHVVHSPWHQIYTFFLFFHFLYFLYMSSGNTIYSSYHMSKIYIC